MGSGVPAADVLPETMVSMNQWLCWRTQERNGKQTKVPVNPHTGAFGSATDPDSWTGFEDARTYAIAGAADGLGFVFTDGDPVAGADLEDCRVPETGTLIDDASDIVEVGRLRSLLDGTWDPELVEERRPALEVPVVDPDDARLVVVTTGDLIAGYECNRTPW